MPRPADKFIHVGFLHANVHLQKEMRFTQFLGDPKRFKGSAVKLACVYNQRAVAINYILASARTVIR